MPATFGSRLRLHDASTPSSAALRPSPFVHVLSCSCLFPSCVTRSPREAAHPLRAAFSPFARSCGPVSRFTAGRIFASCADELRVSLRLALSPPDLLSARCLLFANAGPSGDAQLARSGLAHLERPSPSSSSSFSSSSSLARRSSDQDAGVQDGVAHRQGPCATPSSLTCEDHPDTTPGPNRSPTSPSCYSSPSRSGVLLF